MPKSPKQSITVTPEFYRAVEAYRLKNDIKTWSQALIRLASRELGYTEPPMRTWGGNRK